MRTRALADEALSVLGDRDRFIVEATVMAPEAGRLSDSAAAAVVGVSRATVSRALRTALVKMREALEACEVAGAKAVAVAA